MGDGWLGWYGGWVARVVWLSSVWGSVPTPLILCHYKDIGCMGHAVFGRVMMLLLSFILQETLL